MPGKTLHEMEAEVKAYCEDMGWYETPVSVSTALALLHEEAAEAGRPWRKFGLADQTLAGYQAIPAGVGSELADVVIRLLDDSGRFGLCLPDRVLVHDTGTFVFGGEAAFLDDVNVLHNLISRASAATSEERSGNEGLAMALLDVLAYTFALMRHYRFKIQEEYERKMKYNRTRPHRHGGRRA